MLVEAVGGESWRIDDIAAAAQMPFAEMGGGVTGGLERSRDRGSLRIEKIGLLAVAVIIRFATEILLESGAEVIDALRLPLLATSFGLLLVGLWVNRGYPGLGLAFVRAITRAHRGRLVVTSEPGDTTFRLRLPRGRLEKYEPVREQRESVA